MEKISVIITTYGRAEYLKKAIDSVLNQSYKNIEIIIVDDNGIGTKEGEKTEQVLEHYKGKVIYLKNKRNLGACKARNEGIKLATGKYIAFLDDDDEFYFEKISKQVNQLESYSDIEKVAVSFSRMDLFDINDKKIRVSKFNLKKKINGLNDFLSGTYITGTSSLVFNAKILKELGGFDEIESAQESYLILKILDKGYKFVGIKESLVKYRKQTIGNITNSPKAIIGKRKNLAKRNEILENINVKEKEYKKIKLNLLYSGYFLEESKENKKKILKEIIKNKFLSKELFKIIIKELIQRYN